MKNRILIAVAAVLGVMVGSAATLHAVNFTIVLTQAQVDIATWEWTQEDPSHSIWATAQLFGADKVGQLVAGWKQRRLINRQLILGNSTGYFCTNTWSGLSQGNKDAVCAALGEVAGCTACDASGN